MKNIKKIYSSELFNLAFLIAIVPIVVIVTLTSLLPSMAIGSAPSGLSASVATSSPAGISVGTTASTVFATSTTCAARVISTVGTPIMITFSDFNTPSATFGNVQAASTTVAYDSGLYGCGALKVYGFATTIITATETR